MWYGGRGDGVLNNLEKKLEQTTTMNENSFDDINWKKNTRDWVRAWPDGRIDDLGTLKKILIPMANLLFAEMYLVATST